ncbi:hypothetical protein JCM10213_008826 [Rhodosporidiobolus nylandii]
MTPSLPKELVSDILSYIDADEDPTSRSSSLRALSLVSREMRSLAQPLLFANMALNPYHDDVVERLEQIPSSHCGWVRRLVLVDDEGSGDIDRETGEVCRSVELDTALEVLKLAKKKGMVYRSVVLGDLEGWRNEQVDLAKVLNALQPGAKLMIKRTHLALLTLKPYRIFNVRELAFSGCSTELLGGTTSIYSLFDENHLPYLEHLAITDNSHGLFETPPFANERRLRSFFYRLKTLTIDISNLELSESNPVTLDFVANVSRLLIDCPLDGLFAHQTQLYSGYVRNLRLYLPSPLEQDPLCRDAFKEAFDKSYAELDLLDAEGHAAYDVLWGLRRLTRLLQTQHPLFRRLGLLILPPFLADASFPAVFRSAVDGLLAVAAARQKPMLRIVYEDREELISPYFAAHAPNPPKGRGLKKAEKKKMAREWENAVQEWERANEQEVEGEKPEVQQT